MNTQEARHAMLDGKRTALPDWVTGSYAYYENGQFIHHVIGEPSPEEDDETPLNSSSWLESHDDWYVVEDEKPKFRECKIRLGKNDHMLRFDMPYGDGTCVEPFSVCHDHPDVAGILMPDGLNVIGLFEDIDGVYDDECLLSDLKSGHMNPVDLTQCKVLLRRRDDT